MSMDEEVARLLPAGIWDRSARSRLSRERRLDDMLRVVAALPDMTDAIDVRLTVQHRDPHVSSGDGAYTLMESGRRRSTVMEVGLLRYIQEEARALLAEPA